MDVQGRRIHFAGSASAETPQQTLQYAHDFISQLVYHFAAKGATFAVGVGKEPRASNSGGSLPIIFDWTVLSTAYDCVKNRGVQAAGPNGKLLATVITSKTDQQIPDGRRELWDDLLSSGALDAPQVEQGWTSGAVRRARLAEMGDLLILLSGGEGVEHLAEEYALAGKPVIPLDLDIGSSSNDGAGGAAMLAKRMRAHPDRFVRLANASEAGALLERMRTRQGKTAIPVVVQAVQGIIDALEPPKAFYVRLLNPKSPEFSAVESFFRDAVDPFIAKKGYKAVEMGRSEAAEPFMNVGIFKGLQGSDLVVVDLTALRPNCFVELGYALGLPRRVILTARKGTEEHLPFDTDALDFCLWGDTKPVRERIDELEKYWRRNINRPALVEPRGLL